MKPKSFFFTFFISLPVIFVLVALTSPATAQRTKADLITKSEKDSIGRKKDADYWLDKAGLCATYGNNQAAIKYFQKVISLEPQRSEAFFGEGVSYGQLGKFFKAIELIDRAIELDPQKGLYYYGRGRVYLLAGEKEKAMDDFEKAAGLGDEDAQNYLNRIAQNHK
jgi:tetratricopeptide (TPR) repeat protein